MLGLQRPVSHRQGQRRGAETVEVGCGQPALAEDRVCVVFYSFYVDNTLTKS